MKDAIKNAVHEHIAIISWYAFSITVIMAIIIISKRNKTAKYITWKKEKINLLGLYQKEWGQDKDEVMQEFFEENHRLEKKVNLLNDEIKALKKQYDNLSLGASLSILFMFSVITMQNFFRNKK